MIEESYCCGERLRIFGMRLSATSIWHVHIDEEGLRANHTTKDCWWTHWRESLGIDLNPTLATLYWKSLTEAYFEGTYHSCWSCVALWRPCLHRFDFGLALACCDVSKYAKQEGSHIPQPFFATPIYLRRSYHTIQIIRRLYRSSWYLVQRSKNKSVKI